jgi:hypothetical protein
MPGYATGQTLAGTAITSRASVRGGDRPSVQRHVAGIPRWRAGNTTGSGLDNNRCMGSGRAGNGSAIPHRDRDESGRPRNARPRDALGRPLPRGRAGVPRATEGVRRSPEETLRNGQDLLDAGLPFHAHEVFEDAWKQAGEPDRELWRGLAQLAVGLTHAARGNRAGAAALLRRAAKTMAPYAAAAPHQLDVAALLAWADQLVQGLDAGADCELNPPRLRRFSASESADAHDTPAVEPGQDP